MTVTMPVNLVDDGARLVHPAKAYILRHIPLPLRYRGTWDRALTAEEYLTESNVGDGELVPMTGDPDLTDYLLRLHQSVETLFGSVDFDMHTRRTYMNNGLDFHQDYEDDDERELVRMVTCIHNATDQDRPLHFQRPDWSNHTEEFTLLIPAQRILLFGGPLISEYSHGIPPGDGASHYRSVITRFSRWRNLKN